MEFNQTNQNQGDVNNHASTPSPSAAELTGLRSTMSLPTRAMWYLPRVRTSRRAPCPKSAALSLAILFMDRCPPSRELSLALTNLEQAVFWANASIARNE